MSARHTPGPWITDGSDIFAGENGEHVASAHLVDVGDYHANARLIAAAPEMLAALKSLVRSGLVYRNVVAAIAKAEGKDA